MMSLLKYLNVVDSEEWRLIVKQWQMLLYLQTLYLQCIDICVKILFDINNVTFKLEIYSQQYTSINKELLQPRQWNCPDFEK